MRTYLDDLFRSLAEDFSGDADSPTGWFSLVEIPEHPEQIDALMGEVMGDDWTNGYFEAPESGWYIVSGDSCGFTYWGREDSEQVARLTYRAMEDEYTQWLDQDETEDVDAEKLHTWERSRFTNVLSCAACGLVPLDEEDMETECAPEPREDDGDGWTVSPGM